MCRKRFVKKVSLSLSPSLGALLGNLGGGGGPFTGNFER